LKRRSVDGLEWLEAELPGATVAFTTRRGGLGRAPYDTLNLGLITGDDGKVVLGNRARVAAALGVDPEGIRTGLQVHGSEILVHDDPGEQGQFLEPVPNLTEADGHVSRSPGIPMLVLAADCLPVAIKGPGGLAMLHCGWRGLAGSLVEDAVAMVAGDAAVIGPGIGRCCFEVGADVKQAFADLGEGIFDGRFCDLPEVAARLLEVNGVDSIERAGICTFCEKADFFSHRRDRGVTGRQAGIAWLN
jgi:YfiH family protein